MARSISDKLAVFYFKPMPGMNAKVEDLELATKYAQIAQNCRFENEPGAVVKRKPVSYFNGTSLGSKGLMGSYRFYTTGGIAKWIVVWDDRAYVGDDAAGTFTLIRTMLNSDKRIAFETYGDLLIASNGYDDIWCYDGSSDNLTWELGSCKAKAGTGTGITRTSISYAITIDNDAYVCGAVSNEIASVTNKNILLSHIPLGPIGTANRKVYRKSSETTGSYKLVGTISDNSTTTFTDTTADASAASTLPAVNDDMPKGNVLKIYRERLFITGDPDNPNRIYYSEPYLPGYIQQTTNLDYMEVSKDDGDEIMGIPIQLGTMVCVKKNTIRKLYITSPTSGVDPTTWYADDPLVFSGSPAKWSIVQTSYGVIYLGWDHWYLFNGSGSVPIIDEFDTTDILPALYSSVVAYEHLDVLYASYSDTAIAAQDNNRVMLWNFKRQALSIDTLNVNTFAAKRGDDENGDLYYGSSTDGYLLRASNEDIFYRLSDKTNALLGTQSTVFVGGKESSPYIEIGEATLASAIPEKICILWDSQDTNPGVGWTEITSMDGKLIYIDNVNAPGTVNASVGIAGITYPTWTTGTAYAVGATVIQAVTVYVCNTAHTAGTFADDLDNGYWTVRGSVFTEAVTTDYRLFYKNASTTETQFPEGAIIFWDQVTPPDGFVNVDNPGKYITINSTLADDKTIKITGITDWETEHDYKIGDIVISSTATYVCAVLHTSATFSDDLAAGYWTVQTGNISAIENKLEVYLIKKVGEADTWDGLAYYVYALYYDTVAPSAFSDVTGSYTGHYLKTVESGAPTAFSGSNVLSKTDWIQRECCDHQESYTSSAKNSSGKIVEADISRFGEDDDDDTTFADAYDRDPADARTYYVRHNGDGSVTADLTHEHTWADERTISNIYVKMGQSTYGGNYKDSHRTYTVYLKINGTWTQVDTSAVTTPGVGSNTKYTETREVTLSTGWSNVTGIKVYVYGYAYSYEGNRRQEVWLRIFDVRVEGYVEAVSFHLARMILGKMQDWNAALTATYTAGTWTSPVINIRAKSMGRLNWNRTIAGSDTAALYFRTASTEAGCLAAAWSPAITDTIYVDLSTYVTADAWVQYKIEFTATDTIVTNPRVYYSDGFVIRFSYSQSAALAESNVEFRYKTGFRNFDQPFLDKIYKKLVMLLESSGGSMTISWETENATGSFIVDLTSLPSRWESFFQDNAMGRLLGVEIYKNDLADFKIKEIMGAYAALPAIV